jgi:hypothetical protein
LGFRRQTEINRGGQLFEQRLHISIRGFAAIRHADKMAIVASGLAEWDVNVNPKSHYEVSVFPDSKIPEYLFGGQEPARWVQLCAAGAQ